MNKPNAIHHPFAVIKPQLLAILAEIKKEAARGSR